MLTYEEIIDRLKRKQNFSFSRLGDGEFNAILGAPQGQTHNCDGHLYFGDLGLRLKSVIENYQPHDYYHLGLQPLVARLRADDEEFKALIDGIHWVDADMIHKQSIRTGGNLSDLFDALKERDIIFVANDLLIPMNSYLSDPFSQYRFNQIVIGRLNCWVEYNDVLKRLKQLIQPDTVILYCASMMSEVLIDDIWNDYGTKVTQIDIGSAFDPIVGEITRSYHKKLKL